MLARSVLLRYREALGEDIGEIPAGLYPGDYLVPLGEALKAIQRGAAHDAGRQALAIVRTGDRGHDGADPRRSRRAQRASKSSFRRSLHTVAPSASARPSVTLFKEADRLQDKLPPPKAGTGLGRPQADVFRSSRVSDDMDRPLMKSDGSFTYSPPTFACFHGKYGAAITDDLRARR
ncbi:MAG: hypothetical protein H6891_11495 [Brucellaceae bacterium]|nr:hypothetical protein [Brucellaceae bacterium]